MSSTRSVVLLLTLASASSYGDDAGISTPAPPKSSLNVSTPGPMAKSDAGMTVSVTPVPTSKATTPAETISAPTVPSSAQSPAPATTTPALTPKAPTATPTPAPKLATKAQPLAPTMPVATAPTEMAAAEDPPVWVFTANVEEGLSVNRIDGRFGAQAGVLAQSRYQMRATPVGPVDHQFQVPIVRPYLRAHVLVPWVRLFVQAELAGTPRLLDLELDVQPMPWLGLKFGQFVTPFSRAFMTMVPKFLMPTLSIANTYYRADRDTGVMLYGMPAQGRLEYFAGVFNGNGIDKTTNDNREFSYVARFAGTPYGDAPNTTGHVHYDDTPTLAGPVRPTLQLGINGSYNHTAPTTQVIDAATMQFVTRPLETHRLLTGGIDGQFRVSYFVLQGEFFIRRDAPDNARPIVSMGGSVQTSVMLVPKWFELAARFALVNLNVTDAVPAQIETYELQAATYPIGNHLKGIVSYTLGHSRGALLGYPDGVSHTVLAQAQLWL